MTSTTTPPIDFARAFLSWTTIEGSSGTWRVIASARPADAEPAEGFVLAPMVMAGDVYGAGRLPKDPAYTFQILASSKRHAIIRDFGPGAIPKDSAAENGAVFASLTIEAPPIRAPVIEITSLDPQRTKDYWPVTARVALVRARAEPWVLDFPILHLNHQRTGAAISFQVETGPVLVPEELVEALGVTRIGGFALAYVFFNRLDSIDLALFGPVSGGRSRRAYVHFKRLPDVDIRLYGKPENA